MNLKERIQKRAKELFPDMKGIREHLHAHPELSFKEYETSRFLQDQLMKAGIPFTKGHAGTGIVALIEGTDPGKKVLLSKAFRESVSCQGERAKRKQNCTREHHVTNCNLRP